MINGRRSPVLMVAAAVAAYAPAAKGADAPPPAEGPCAPLLAHLETLKPDGVVTPDVYAGEGLTAYLQRSEGEPGATLALASVACREEVRRDRAAPVPAFVRDLLARVEPGWVNVGRMVACAVQDPAYLLAVPEWVGDVRHAEARAACFASLPTWPGAGAVRSSAYARAVRQDDSGWHVDRALLAVLGSAGQSSAEARAQLAPVLQAANEHRAIGFDSLRASACLSNDRPSVGSSELARICRETSDSSEARWREDRHRGRRWAIRLGAAVPYLGAIALTYATRDSDLGLGLATGAGAVGGASVGILLGALAGLADADPDYVEVAIFLGAAALGTLGGIAAHAAVDDAPEWRAPLTGAALLIPLTMVWGSARSW